MSKTVSGQDVEDMLSSVRRLVSSELPPHRRTSRIPEGEKLLLTEAQRIEPVRRAERPRSMRLEDRIAELEAAVSKTPDEWEPDGSEDQAQHRPDHMVYTPPAQSRRTTRRTSRITLLETEARGTTEDEEDTSARYLSEAEIEAEAAAAAQTSAQDAVSEQSAFDAALKDAVADSVREVVETEVAEAMPEVTPPEPGAPERDAMPEPSAPEEVAEIPATALDAEALRPIVNRLIREELQGEIGERITRNVRKLVRQEIQRALSMHDLD